MSYTQYRMVSTGWLVQAVIGLELKTFNYNMLFERVIERSTILSDPRLLVSDWSQGETLRYIVSSDTGYASLSGVKQ